jgi:hypothetical protein
MVKTSAIAIGLVALLAVSAASAQTGAASGSPAPDASAAAENVPADAELERLVTELGSDSVEERRAAAKALSVLGEDAVPSVLRKLSELRRGGDGGVVAAMKPVRERASKDPAFDLVEGLVEQRPDTGVKRALTAACLLRTLAHVGTAEAVRGMIPLAGDLAGQLRPELSRQIKQLGEHAVAGLLEARHEPSAEVRGWASSQLEALGKRTPGDTVQTSDSQVISDVLRAYGGLKELDALPVVLSFVNSDRATVRAAAREATLAYGQDGLWKLREAYSVLTGDPAPEGSTAADLAKKLFEAYDRYRLEEVYTLLEDGLAKQRAHDLKSAIAAFDEVLARQPLLDRRAEMAPAYADYGESLQDSDRPAALTYLRKALRLDDTGDRAKHVQSELLRLQGEDLVARGIADTQPFEQALTLDPTNARARADLDRLRAQAQAGRSRAYRLAAAGGLLVLAFIGITVFGGRPRRQKS